MINDNKAINMLSALKKEVGLLDISSCEIGKFEAHINSAQQLLIENYGSIMPKIFDDWHEEELELCSCCEDEIDDLINMCFNPKHNSVSAYQLFEWINQIDQDDIKANIGRFLKCIDAIRYGYEVEK